jgi:hypothetical protein
MSRLRPPSPILRRLQWQVCGDCITQAQLQPLALRLPLTIQTLPNATRAALPPRMLLAIVASSSAEQALVVQK